MEELKKENIINDLKLSVNAAGHLLMKANTDEEMESYVTQTVSYKSAILTATKKLVLITAGMLLSGPGMALGLLFTQEINKVSKLKNKVGTAKKLKAQYTNISNNIDKSINAEQDKEEPNEQYIRGLKHVKDDIDSKINKIDTIITEESSDRYDATESYNLKLNGMLKEYLAEDFYGVDDEASKLEDDAIAGAKEKDTPTENPNPEGDSKTTKDVDGNEKEQTDTGTDSTDDDTESDTTDEDGEDTESDVEGEEDDGTGLDDDQPEEPKFGNRRIICDRFVDLREKFKTSLEILYKVDSSKTNNEALTKFLETKLLKSIDKISIVIEKQIETIDYNKLVVYDVYFKEIYLSTNEIIKTLI